MLNKVDSVHVFWVHDFWSWSVTLFDKEERQIGESAYHHYKGDAIKDASAKAEEQSIKLKIFTKIGRRVSLWPKRA